MAKKQLINTKPAYYRGQLLLEDDFTAEQQYHVDALHHHILNLHGWGIFRGLEITVRGDSAITVSPGFAVDGKGHEIEIAEEATLDLSTFAPNSKLTINLNLEEKSLGEREQPKRIESYAVFDVSSDGKNAAGLALATLQLDSKGKVVANSIDTSKTRYAHTLLTPGSVTVAALEPALRMGWLRLPFRPSPLDKGPPGEEEIPPPFRVGATEARSHEDYDGKRNDRGAGGTMAISIPPSVTKLHRFRIAGEENSSRIQLKLVLGGWDTRTQKHFRKSLLDETITGRPYEKTFPIPEAEIDPEYHTLSIWIRGYGKTSISLIAFEYAY